MPFLILTILSVIATYAVCRDAQSRGMNAPLWCAIVLCSTMLLLPVYLVMRRRATG